MKVNIFLFASFREAIGQRQLELTVPDGATLGDVWHALQAQYPKLRIPRPAAAVNEEYATFDTPVHDGDDIAFLPPVSGGEDQVYRITDQPLNTQAIEAAVTHPGAGAIVTFQGVVRDNNLGKSVEHLVYEAYPPMAEKVMAQIGEEVAQQWPGARCAMAHRIGALAIGEASVVIAVSTPHRADAFAACHYAIDRL